ncbi:MAG: hypothetical protein AB1568_17590 [Thermodesulfobacteriota bacterium]
MGPIPPRRGDHRRHRLPAAGRRPAARPFSRHGRSGEEIADIYDRAIFVFLTVARCQFFYDVNKRMGRFLMNGILLEQVTVGGELF